MTGGSARSSRTVRSVRNAVPLPYTWRVNRWDGVVRLSAVDALLFASDEWRECARAHAGVEEVVGRPFSEFVADPDTVPLYDLVFRRVRASGQPMNVPFRCETPEERRHMEMEVRSLGDGVLECHTRTVLVERPAASASSRAPAAHFLTLCGWCRRVRLPEGTWADLETAAQRLSLFLGEVPKVTHGICPHCRESRFPALSHAR